MIDFFRWTGDHERSDEPEWIVAALADGRAVIEASGAESVSLVIDGLRFNRGSTILRSDVECGWAIVAMKFNDPDQ